MAQKRAEALFVRRNGAPLGPGAATAPRSSHAIGWRLLLAQVGVLSAAPLLLIGVGRQWQGQ